MHGKVNFMTNTIRKMEEFWKRNEEYKEANRQYEKSLEKWKAKLDNDKHDLIELITRNSLDSKRDYIIPVIIYMGTSDTDPSYRDPNYYEVKSPVIEMEVPRFIRINHLENWGLDQREGEHLIRARLKEIRDSGLCVFECNSVVLEHGVEIGPVMTVKFLSFVNYLRTILKEEEKDGSSI